MSGSDFVPLGLKLTPFLCFKGKGSREQHRKEEEEEEEEEASNILFVQKIIYKPFTKESETEIIIGQCPSHTSALEK